MGTYVHACKCEGQMTTLSILQLASTCHPPSQQWGLLFREALGNLSLHNQASLDQHIIYPFMKFEYQHSSSGLVRQITKCSAKARYVELSSPFQALPSGHEVA